jgi:hypothetical protein
VGEQIALAGSRTNPDLAAWLISYACIRNKGLDLDKNAPVIQANRPAFGVIPSGSDQPQSPCSQEFQFCVLY